MAYGIERRLKRELFPFAIVSKDFFEDINNYIPATSQYKHIIDTYLTDGWTVVREGIWYHSFLAENHLPEQGFKIHISATSKTAQEVLQRVMPICAENGVAFKVLVDDFILDFSTSKNFPRSASGKFITIYPASDSLFVRLLESLYQATSDLRGPHVLSDKPYKDSKVVFYRYGGFIPQYRLNIFGERISVIQSPEGKLIPDDRVPFFRLPEYINDPFESQDLYHEGEVLLKNRYRVKSTILFSNSGGIYTADDISTNETVILKEARPFINESSSNSEDAIVTLKKEASILERLGHTKYVPRLVDYFQEWEHHFLVEEYLEGIPLSSYRAIDDVGLLLQRTITPEIVGEFCTRLHRISVNLIEAVQAFHEKGIIIGDLSPSNIMVDTESLDLKFIDFEGAFISGETDLHSNSTITAGFVSPSRLSGESPSPRDDYYSLGAVIYSIIFPVQEYFHLNPDAKNVFIEELTRDFALPTYVREVILALMDGDLDKSLRLMESATNNHTININTDRQANRLSVADIEEVIARISDYILWSADAGRTDRLFPADYRIFTTNPLNLAYGALGVALYLKKASGEIPRAIEEWILDQPITCEEFPPGLFVGMSGIAWALSELGYCERAASVMNLTYESPLITEGTDIFYGAAGIGLASLFFWRKTGENHFLDNARKAGDRILGAAQSDESGYYWINADGGLYYGYAHGSAGISLFLLYLHLATGEDKYLKYAIAGMDYEIAQGVVKDDYIVWNRSNLDNFLSPYWRYGNAGIGSVLIRFFEILKEDRYKAVAEKAARYLALKYAVLPGQFIGLSGIGEFLIDMYYFTEDRRYIDQAFKVAEGVLLFQIKRPQGVAFPGEELIRISDDYGTGSAGIGMFLLRLLRPEGRLLYEFDPMYKRPF